MKRTARKLSARVFRRKSGFAPPEKTRDRILQIVQAALDSLYEEGFDRTSFETVGKRCRMRRSHIAYYFKRREDMLEAVFRYIADSAQKAVVAEIAPATTPSEQIEALIRGHFRWAERSPKLVLVMMLFYFQAMRVPRFADLHHEIREVGTDRIAAVVRLGLGIAPKPAYAIAKNIQALLTGNIIDHFSTGGALPLERACEFTLAGARQLWGSAAAGAAKREAPIPAPAAPRPVPRLTTNRTSR
jgi:AcrR family transcriptional regulator